uniref:phospholipase B1, membrane-associated-like n=1 Tax=Epinephelus lanceolatus TaxID=310571 RepID=UPI0014456EE6|nr:phospholipase B1, membrane-associated-like [Epinephelus lanceolatus]
MGPQHAIEMERAHRTGKPAQNGRSRLVVVKFLCYKDKQAVLTKAKLLKDKPPRTPAAGRVFILERTYSVSVSRTKTDDMMLRTCVLFAVCVSAARRVDGDTLWREEEEEEEGHVHQDILGTDFLRHPLHPPFVCPDMSPSPTVPTSVERVKAADIRVIAALGDSLTTAIGANGSSILATPFEFRHVSWSIGGYGTYQNVITLANIFKLFNPNLLGPSPVWTFHGQPTTVNQTGFNFAVTGHNTLNVSDQIRHMIDTFRSYPGLNYDEDWKVVTMLIGMNDICDYCKDKVRQVAQLEFNMNVFM